MSRHLTFLRRASLRPFALLGKAIAVFVAAAAGMVCMSASAQLSQPSAVPPIVQTSQGAVSGKLLNGTRTFLGLPYAVPPVGTLRWQPPSAAPSWTGTRQSTTAGSPCPQPKNVVAGNGFTEDCLYLNVHVPADIGNEKLPVIVWIHGGAFLTGSNSLYDLSHMARKAHAVVVAINYRLGAFGFFRLPDDGTEPNRPPANFGLMDQQAALRWVKNEIGRFGGDASRVTLMGQSAGGASGCMHMVAPASAGLFHGLIMQSGLCRPVGSPTTEGLENTAAQLGRSLGCSQGPGQLECMRTKPAGDVLAASATSGRVIDTGLLWAPVPDGVTLMEDPTQMVREGRFQRVPVMMGSNHDEGRFFVAVDYHIRTLLPVTTRQMNEAFERVSEGDAAFATTLASTYTAKAYGSRDKALGALITDIVASCKIMDFAEDLARHTPVYFYEFNEPSTPGMIDPYMGMGAFHAVELRYLFQVKLAGPTFNLPLSKAQQKLADTMVSYWAGLAAQGAPQAPGAPAWPRFAPTAPSSLSLASSGIKLFDARAFREDHQCAVWGDRRPK
jgi:para-nitrobenzyl esterase